MALVGDAGVAITDRGPLNLLDLLHCSPSPRFCALTDLRLGILRALVAPALMSCVAHAYHAYHACDSGLGGLVHGAILQGRPGHRNERCLWC